MLECIHLPIWSCLGLYARGFFFYLEVAPAPVAHPLCSCGHPSRFVLLVLYVHFDGSCLLLCSAVVWVLVTVCGTVLFGVASVFCDHSLVPCLCTFGWAMTWSVHNVTAECQQSDLKLVAVCAGCPLFLPGSLALVVQLFLMDLLYRRKMAPSSLG